MTSAETAPTIAISATFTAEPVEESLRFWIDELGWRDAIRFAPFNQGRRHSGGEDGRALSASGPSD